MRKMILFTVTALMILGSCKGNATRSDTVEEGVARWLMQVFSWYENHTPDVWPGLTWDKNGIPYMPGKEKFLKWLDDSKFFTDRFLTEIKTYLDGCESRGRKDPDMDHYGCLEQDLLSDWTFDKYHSVSNVSIEDQGAKLMVTFTVSGTRGKLGRNPKEIS